MSFEFFENEASYISKSEISEDARTRIAKRLGHLTVTIS